MDLYDVMNNKYSSQPTDHPEITLISKFENLDNYLSPLRIVDPYLNLAIEYAGISQSNSDGSYKLSMSMLKTGIYKMYTYINNKEIQSNPFSIEVQPSLIDADKCLSVPLS